MDRTLSHWLAAAGATPEAELVVRASSPVSSEALDDAVRDASVRVQDWDLIAQLCRWHSTTKLVCGRLQRLGLLDSAIPAHVQLRRRALDMTAHGMRYVRELVRIVNALGREQIAVLPFKGPVLAAQAYGDPLVRQFVDLDLLVRSEDMVRARGVLEREGYALSLDLSTQEQAALARAGWEYCMVNADRTCQVDLETVVVPAYFSFDLDMHRLWEDAVDIDLDGTPVRTLSPARALVLLCVHGTKHNWTQHIWVADIAGLITRTVLDWDSVVQFARAGSAERMVAVGLRLAEILMAASVPPGLPLRGGDAGLVDRLAGQAARYTLSAPVMTMGRFEELVFHVRCRERLADRVRHITRLAACPSYSDWKTLPLPRTLRPLYYLTRPFRLSVKGLRTLLRIAPR
jgi:hypothetical protein